MFEGEALDENDDAFVDAIEAATLTIHSIAQDKGWWTSPNKGEKLALIHSEVSEALEGARAGNPPSEKIPPFTAEEEELADVVIRILDYAGHYGLLIGPAIVAKVAFNRRREFRHGGKAF